MPGSVIVDVLLILVLIAYLVYGFQNGLVRSLSGIVGVVLGGLAAILLVPLVNAWIPDPTMRTIATFAVVVALIVGGHSAGAAVGAVIHRRVRRTRLHVADRLLGAVLTTVVAALVASMVGASISALGIPVLSSAISSSSVLRTINNLTPVPVQSFLAQLRSVTVGSSLPRLAQLLGGGTTTTQIPNVSSDSPALVAASRSVVKITGNAYACGQSQSGSGFVVARDRVITNAHVVAGVSQPVIELRDGGALQARVVYFDPSGDLAVLEVPGLNLPALGLTTTLPVGSAAVSDGYPYGGPFTSIPVGIAQVGTANVPNIYGGSPAPREIYSLAADVQQGDSGGPLLAQTGKVAGVIFAKGATTNDVGYAITMKELDPVAAKAPTLTARVSSGQCVKG